MRVWGCEMSGSPINLNGVMEMSLQQLWDTARVCTTYVAILRLEPLHVMCKVCL